MNTLKEMFRPHPEIPLQTGNSTAEDKINRIIVQKRSKAMDMRFSWLCNQDNQKHFQLYWSLVSCNLGGYQTKYHQAAHHRTVHNIYSHRKTKEIQEQKIRQGCINPEGPRTACEATFLAEALKSTGFQTRILSMNKCGYAFKFVYHITTQTK